MRRLREASKRQPTRLPDLSARYSRRFHATLWITFGTQPSSRVVCFVWHERQAETLHHFLNFIYIEKSFKPVKSSSDESWNIQMLVKVLMWNLSSVGFLHFRPPLKVWATYLSCQLKFILRGLRHNQGAILISHEDKAKAQRIQILKRQQRHRERLVWLQMKQSLTSTDVSSVHRLFCGAVKSALKSSFKRRFQRAPHSKFTTGRENAEIFMGNCQFRLIREPFEIYSGPVSMVSKRFPIQCSPGRLRHHSSETFHT